MHPNKLIKINLGNISNEELIKIISDNLAAIEKLYSENRFLVEMDKDFTCLFVKKASSMIALHRIFACHPL